MARLADMLLMKLHLNEADDDDHRSSKATSTILSLVESGAIDDSGIVYLLLCHDHDTDNVLRFWRIFILIIYQHFKWYMIKFKKRKMKI